ncbi:hypothetical protein [Flavobacterium sp. N1994]|uniref:hypothetical protein n=1 Tax=Flavobacterium sp. N1994 TaxID=2986827 RepID=UPI00222238E7|nr:hypothetical protein [Flavobacterium sp. N1994]
MKKYLSLRTLYHILIGIAIGYDFFLVCGLNTKNFPLTVEYWNNYFTPLIGLLPAGFICFKWDQWQQEKFKVNQDIVKVYITAVSGVFGGLFDMLYPNWIFAVVFSVVSVVLILRHYKE